MLIQKGNVMKKLLLVIACLAATNAHAWGPHEQGVLTGLVAGGIIRNIVAPPVVYVPVPQPMPIYQMPPPLPPPVEICNPRYRCAPPPRCYTVQVVDQYGYVRNQVVCQ